MPRKDTRPARPPNPAVGSTEEIDADLAAEDRETEVLEQQTRALIHIRESDQAVLRRRCVHSRLVTALRSRGVTVVTVMDAGLTEKTDEEQLAFATENECVLYTSNVSDFYRLPTQ